MRDALKIAAWLFSIALVAIALGIYTNIADLIGGYMNSKAMQNLKPVPSYMLMTALMGAATITIGCKMVDRTNKTTNAKRF